MDEKKGVDEEGNLKDSPTDEKPVEGEPQPDGGKKPDDPYKDLPFHEHPRWKEREDAWNKRMQEQDDKFQRELAAVKSGIPVAPKKEESDIPEWFGGDAKQWAAYQEHNNHIIEEAEKRAYEKIQGEQKKQADAIKDANDWFDSEVSALEKENTDKIDRNLLLKTCLDNECIDSKGRWNYRAAYRIMKGAVAEPNKDRKKLADATFDNRGGGEPESKTFKTSEDFKKERPW